jgi:transposase
LKTYGIEHRFFHLDSSSIHLHGQYSAEEPQIEAIEITYGYSKDHRPDLKQVVVSLITGHRSQLPVWMEALSGNHSDKDSFPETIQAFCRQLKAGERCFMVVDSALYRADNLQNLSETRWLTRVLADHRKALPRTWSTTSCREKCRFLSRASEDVRRSLGRIILATNETDPKRLSPEAMLSQYKAQAVSVERGFRFLKDPLFFADSLFLKNPDRIMALIMIMVLALLVYSLAERKLRLHLSDSGQCVIIQFGKETQTPTLRWIF